MRGLFCIKNISPLGYANMNNDCLNVLGIYFYVTEIRINNIRDTLKRTLLEASFSINLRFSAFARAPGRARRRHRAGADLLPGRDDSHVFPTTLRQFCVGW